MKQFNICFLFKMTITYVFLINMDLVKLTILSGESKDVEYF